jgi:hypothetical protein
VIVWFFLRGSHSVPFLCLFVFICNVGDRIIKSGSLEWAIEIYPPYLCARPQAQISNGIFRGLLCEFYALTLIDYCLTFIHQNISYWSRNWLPFRSTSLTPIILTSPLWLLKCYFRDHELFFISALFIFWMWFILRPMGRNYTCEIWTLHKHVFSSTISHNKVKCKISVRTLYMLICSRYCCYPM